MLMADFLHERIERELIDEDNALWVARQWLYEGPKELFEQERRQ